jgi:hypothetical protein
MVVADGVYARERGTNRCCTHSVEVQEAEDYRRTDAIFTPSNLNFCRPPVTLRSAYLQPVTAAGQDSSRQQEGTTTAACRTVVSGKGAS